MCPHTRAHGRCPRTNLDHTSMRVTIGVSVAVRRREYEGEHAAAARTIVRAWEDFDGDAAVPASNGLIAASTRSG